MITNPWRTGNHQGRTIYEITEVDDERVERLIGVMDTPELASEAVSAHNERLARWRAAGEPDTRTEIGRAVAKVDARRRPPRVEGMLKPTYPLTTGKGTRDHIGERMMMRTLDPTDGTLVLAIFRYGPEDLFCVVDRTTHRIFASHLGPDAVRAQVERLTHPDHRLSVERWLTGIFNLPVPPGFDKIKIPGTDTLAWHLGQITFRTPWIEEASDDQRS